MATSTRDFPLFRRLEVGAHSNYVFRRLSKLPGAQSRKSPGRELLVELLKGMGLASLPNLLVHGLDAGKHLGTSDVRVMTHGDSDS